MPNTTSVARRSTKQHRQPTAASPLYEAVSKISAEETCSSATEVLNSTSATTRRPEQAASHHFSSCCIRRTMRTVFGEQLPVGSVG